MNKKILPKFTRYTQIKSYNDNLFRKKITKNKIENLGYNIDTPTNTVEMFSNFRKKIFDICNPYIDNLSDFEYVYFTNGITSGLDLLLQKHQTQADEKEWRYIFFHSTVTNDFRKYRYETFPSCYDGKFREISSSQKIILDCAYLFASNMIYNKFIPSNVEYLLLSFTKSHNLADLRAGVIFSKNKIDNLHVLQYDYGYGDLIYNDIFSVINDYNINLLYKKYDEDFRQLYDDYGLQVNDTNLFGVNELGQRYPYYVL